MTLSPLTGRVAVLSPHLDDAVYSLGAALAEATRRGAKVSLVTVFAGDPASPEPASPWDRRLGFEGAAEAARARREEDARACELLGLTPVWLPFDDLHGRRPDEDELEAALSEALQPAEIVLVPGFPLDHEDHVRLARSALSESSCATGVGLYVEQPYAAVRGQPPHLPDTIADLFDRDPEWRPLPASLAARWRKVRGWRAYRSQLRHFGYRSLVNVLRYEARYGGELTTLQ